MVTDCHRLEFVSPDGKIAGDARKQLEKETNKNFVSKANYLPKNQKKSLLKDKT